MDMFKEKSKNTSNFDLVAWCWGLIAGALVFFSLLYLAVKDIVTFNSVVSFQIDPTNVLTLVVTTYIAVIILRPLNRQEEGDKLERQLFIETLRDFYTKVNQDTHSMTVATGVDGKVVASTMKNLNLALQETIILINMSPCDNKTNIDLLNKQFGVLRDLFTYVPEVEDTSSDVLIENGSMYYSQAYLGKISKELGEIKKTIFSIIFNINRS